MSLNKAIQGIYGVRLGYISPDGRFRKFRIDQFRLGFVCNLEDCAFFGCRADRVVYAWNEHELTKVNLEIHDSEKIKFERFVVECARGLIARGEILNAKDADRLSLAVERLSEA